MKHTLKKNIKECKWKNPTRTKGSIMQVLLNGSGGEDQTMLTVKAFVSQYKMEKTESVATH